MKVWVKPGFVNRLSALGKRGWTIVVLGVALCIAVFMILCREENSPDPVVSPGVAVAQPRRQLAQVRADFVFESERTLACFARPGDLSQLPDEGDVEGVFGDLRKALRYRIGFEDDDSPELRCLKGIVVGLKDEARVALASHESPAAFLHRLIERQRTEAAHRQSVLDSLRTIKDPKERARRIKAANESLSNTGLREISTEELETHRRH